MTTCRFWLPPVRLLAAFSLAAAGLLLLWLMTLPGGVARAAGTILRVPADFPSIQDAIDAAQPGDEIRVLGGPDVQTPATYQEQLTITTAITLSGCWTADYSEQHLSQYPTILDADGGGRAITIIGPVSTTVGAINNLIIPRGDATGLGGWQRDDTLAPLPAEYDLPGPELTTTVSLAGVMPLSAPPLVSDRQAQLTDLLARLHVTPTASPVAAAGGPVQAAATVVDCGGGIYSSNASLHLNGTVVADNQASTTRDGYGGGVCVVTAPAGGVQLEGNAIKDNQGAAQANGNGGGLFMADTPGALLADNAISGNRGTQGGRGAGGGVFIAANGVSLTNNEISLNTASAGGEGQGGGLMLQSPAATVSGRLQQPGGQGGIDDIHDHGEVGQQFGRDRQGLVQGGHADRGGVDQGIGLDAGEFVAGDKGAGQLGGQIPAPGLGAVGEQDPGPGLEQAKAHRPGGTAGADDQHRAPFQVHGLGQGLVCAQPVGVEAEAAGRTPGLGLKDQGVDRADPAGDRIHLVDQGHHRHLVRHGHRDADKAEGAQAADPCRKFAGPHGNVDPVDT